MVGVADKVSLKIAVMVTKLEAETKLSESVSESVTVGAVLSIVKVILFDPEYVLLYKSVPERVA